GRERGGGGDQPVEAVSAGRRRAKARRDPAGERRGRADRYLLAEDGANHELGPVPRARAPDARMAGEAAAEQGIAAEARGDDRGIGAEGEDAADALDQGEGGARVGGA